MRMTQSQKLIKLLKQRGNKGVMVWEIIAPKPDGLGIAQYNARIKELREAGNNIINKSPGHFVLETKEPEEAYREYINQEIVVSPEERLKSLEKQFIECTDKSKVKTLLTQIKIVKMGMIERKRQEEKAVKNELSDNAKRAFL